MFALMTLILVTLISFLLISGVLAICNQKKVEITFGSLIFTFIIYTFLIMYGYMIGSNTEPVIKMQQRTEIKN